MNPRCSGSSAEKTSGVGGRYIYIYIYILYRYIYLGIYIYIYICINT